MRPKNSARKKLRPLSQTIAPRNNGKKATIAQSFAMAAPYTTEARNSHDSRSSNRYSSRQRITYAKSNTSNISREPAVAFSQNVSCNPQATAARTGGSHAARIDSSANSLRSRLRCASVRSRGSNAPARTNKASVSAAQTAANKLRATGIAAAGSHRNGRVTSQKTGPLSSGCQFHPEALMTSARLRKETQWFSVSKYTAKATPATNHGRMAGTNFFSGLTSWAVTGWLPKVEWMLMNGTSLQ